MANDLLSLNRLIAEHSQQPTMLEHTKKLVSKWEDTGLLDGLTEENEVNNMALILENQAKQLVREVSSTGTTANSEQWAGVALPLVRRIFGEIAAKEFMSIQPMNLPSGLVFYLDFKYGSGTQPGYTLNQSVYGGSTAAKVGSTDAAQGGFYGAGRFGYSINDFTAASLTGYTTASATWQDVQFAAELSSSIVGGRIRKLSFATSSFTRPDLVGVRAFEISGSGVKAYYPAYTRFNKTNNRIEFFVSASATGTIIPSATAMRIKYHRQPTDSTRGDFEDQSTSGSIDSGAGYSVLDIPEIDIELKSENITAKTRKLKAVFTPELAQDLNAYQSIDAEAELTSFLSEFIASEIDLELLDMLLHEALTTEYWSALPGYEYVAASNSFVNKATHTGTKNEWFQTLGNKIQRVSNLILQKTLRGGANFIVVNPGVATIIESIPGYAADTNGTQMSFAMGVQKVGMLNSRFTVYKNPYMTENAILVGFRGNSFLETGAVYAPYVPLIMSPVVYDPNNLTPRRGVMTRYAKKMLRPEFYGRIIVRDSENV